MSLIHAIPFRKCQRAADVIQSQAENLGYSVDDDQASTGTVYLTLKHKHLCECDDEDCEGECSNLLIRVSDHEANEARYIYRINREPDLDVEVGFQAAAVHWLAKKIGIDPMSISYLKSYATREAKAKAASDEAARRRAEERTNWLAECERKRAATLSSVMNAITIEEAETIRSMRRLPRHEVSIEACRLLRGRADGVSLDTLFEAADKKVIKEF